MDVDWEVEVGGGAPVIEADWPGFIDLHQQPERIGEIAETRAFAPLARLLLALNQAESPLRTSKCDLWEPESEGLACYVDLLPREEPVFAQLAQAEAFCREFAAKLASAACPETTPHPASGRVSPAHDSSFGDSSSESSILLVLRQAVTTSADGFGVTAYLNAESDRPGVAAGALAQAMAIFADALKVAKFSAGPFQS